MNIQSLGIPAAIVIAGAIVAASIVFGGGDSPRDIRANVPNGGTAEQEEFGNTNSAQAANVLPIEVGVDHVRGGNNARVAIIEYSDFECPFCSRFHPTVERIIDDFGGEVAWVYRHFPLTSIHAKATGAALASECVAELGGEDAFWEFTDQAFINQRSLSEDLYLELATDLGVQEEEFILCMTSRRHQDKIQRDLDNAVASGGRGTPYTIVINEKGEALPFSGALPYETVRQVVEQALAN